MDYMYIYIYWLIALRVFEYSLIVCVVGFDVDLINANRGMMYILRVMCETTARRQPMRCLCVAHRL